MAEFRPLALQGAYEILPDKFGDNRGFFSETYNQKLFEDNRVNANFVQDNHSFSAAKGILRGLHFQVAPHAQDKLVRVTKGSVFDVLVDLRRDSSTYRKWLGVEVSAEKWNLVYVPKGFAHGFLTLEENTEFLYKVSEFYAPASDRSIRFDDPDIAIDWPVDLNTVILSDKDLHAPSLTEIESEIDF